ncbi:TetR/AcrR family transcriptional regulator [Kribbella antibiotica]|uniref:TetR/AcrR family transcriptional regulator n=1 Tax=Kribbella antibiotica TaxID=190195 RepID=A0A4R4ZXF0_9ACTN|nr:TetR/AcrR family transcriptional regulator [Kribbella antibiotica]TDD62994.1 TetR/AcrR family transcriptional regulator [Kribbella antibiotica]
MVTRTEWLEAGLDLLADEGAPAVTIERLTGTLGVTKGSYYHHFKGAAGYRTALLEHFEAKFTTRLIDTVEAEPAGDNKLLHLLRLVLADPASARLEIAVRAWALQDAEVRAAQTRVDEARTKYLKALCAELELDVNPDRFAELLYLILIGAEQVLPTMPSDALRDIYAMTLRLATGHGDLG